MLGGNLETLRHPINMRARDAMDVNDKRERDAIRRETYICRIV